MGDEKQSYVFYPESPIKYGTPLYLEIERLARKYGGIVASYGEGGCRIQLPLPRDAKIEQALWKELALGRIPPWARPCPSCGVPARPIDEEKDRVPGLDHDGTWSQCAEHGYFRSFNGTTWLAP